MVENGPESGNFLATREIAIKIPTISQMTDIAGITAFFAPIFFAVDSQANWLFGAIYSASIQ
ncbi:hypothetical protein NYE76_07350 [Paenibacillus sp. FSL M7-0831]